MTETIKTPEDQWQEIVSTHLFSPVFTEYTLPAGLCIWGWEESCKVLLKYADNSRLVRLASIHAQAIWQRKHPIIFVDKETFERMKVKRQVAMKEVV